VFPTRIEEIILTIGELSPHFQIVLTREGRMDRMEIRVEARPEAPERDVRLAAAARLEHIVKNTVGVTACISILDPNDIERSAGKARRVLDHRPGSTLR
jgi:phenylacetate-CoA ligase